MSKIETYLPYSLPDYEEAAYLLAKYFIGHNYEADVSRSKEYPGGYRTLVRRHGLFKNLLGSRTAVAVTFYPASAPVEKQGTGGTEEAKLIESGGEVQWSKETDGEAKERLPAAQGDTAGERLPAQKSEARPPDTVAGGAGTGIEIHSGIVQDGAIKEILTYILVLPALRKLYDYAQIFTMAKTRSVAVCEKLHAQESAVKPAETNSAKPPKGKKGDKS